MPSCHEIYDSNDSLAHQSFGKPIDVLDAEVLNRPRRVYQAKLDLQGLPVTIKIVVEDVLEVDGQGAAMRKDLVAVQS